MFVEGQATQAIAAFDDATAGDDDYLTAYEDRSIAHLVAANPDFFATGAITDADSLDAEDTVTVLAYERPVPDGPWVQPPTLSYVGPPVAPGRAPPLQAVRVCQPTEFRVDLCVNGAPADTATAPGGRADLLTACRCAEQMVDRRDREHVHRMRAEARGEHVRRPSPRRRSSAEGREQRQRR